MQEFLISIITDAGNMAKEYFDRGVRHWSKSNFSDLLTDADIAVNDFLVEKIKEAYPAHRIHSEEMKEDVNPDGEYEWVIDPIDGTRNFAMGISFWCVLVALVKGNDILLGAVYNPIADELFFAEKGNGAFLNGERIRASKKSDFNYSCGSFSRAAIEGPVYGRYTDRYKHFSGRLYKETNTWIHSFGTMLGGCYVANGGMDFFVQNAGLDHDYLPAVLLCREAGAVVTDSDGNPWQRGRQDIVMANPVLHRELLKLFL